MSSRPLPDAGFDVYAADKLVPSLASHVLGTLWFVAGAAMLVFVLFLAVLFVAGVVFRWGNGGTLRRPARVFGGSSILVLVTATALLTPHSAIDKSTSTGNEARVAVAQPGRLLPAVSGLPLKYADGGSRGAGLAQSTLHTLVLYDGAGPSAGFAELDATKLVNLVSHFGDWTAHPIDTYRSGELLAYGATIFLGAVAGGTLPPAFLDDVLHASRQVMWINADIDQLQARDASLWRSRYGFTSRGADLAQAVQVRYRGATLPVSQTSDAGLTRISIDQPTKASALATAVRSDGTTLPWAVRSGNLIYVAEDPLPYLGVGNDRYLALADLLFEALNPAAPEQHRALIRLEDVGPTTDPVKFRAVVDYLSGRGVPFSVAVYPVFRDPNGTSGDGTDITVRLSERPALVAALKYATEHGGDLVLHGYTHQYAAKNNPNNGRSGDDAEFYLSHLDGNQQVQLDGPVPEDSRAWVLGRLDQALADLSNAGLPRPTMFEFPHYMASAADYAAARQRFPFRYERTLYFPGLLSGTQIDDAKRGWQFFPYAVRDVYGMGVIPENLDYVASDGSTIPGMLETARSNLVVRDGVASFFYHPFLGVGNLPRLVDGLRAMGYTFVRGQDLATSL